MVETRSSQETASPKDDTKSNKRSGDRLSSPVAKRGKTSDETPEKGQKTIEESLKSNEKEDDNTNGGENTSGKESEAEANGNAKAEHTQNEDGKNHDDDKKEENNKKNAFDEVKADTDEVKHAARKEQDEKAADINQNNESVVTDEKREESMPSTILEKGIIYFFFRGRVGVDEPQGLQDVARSYIVLRPLPLGAKIGSGPLEDSGNSRLLALPKKMLPKSHKDRFLTFVEKVPTSIKDLREQFSGNEYATQTVG